MYLCELFEVMGRGTAVKIGTEGRNGWDAEGTIEAMEQFYGVDNLNEVNAIYPLNSGEIAIILE